MSNIDTLSDREVDQVNGGGYLAVALAAYATANIAYQFYKGMRDGVSGVHEEVQ